MSKLTVQSLVKSGRKALESGNIFGALTIALTLPSVCSRIEYKDEKYKDKFWEIHKKKDTEERYIKWFDQECYKAWCNAHCSLYPWLTAKQLYDIRCNMIHEGEADGWVEDIPITFILKDDIHDDNAYYEKIESEDADIIRVRPEILINPVYICKRIFESVDSWCDSFLYNDRSLLLAEFFDEKIPSDRSVLNHKREVVRTEYLANEHEEHLRERIDEHTNI